MKYGDIVSARKNYAQFNREYQWAKSVLDAFDCELREKNIRLSRDSSPRVISLLISKLNKRCTGKDQFRLICEMATAYLEWDRCMTEFEKTGEKKLLDEAEKKSPKFINARTKYSSKSQTRISNPIDIIKEFVKCLEKHRDQMLEAASNAVNGIKPGPANVRYPGTLEICDDNLRYSSAKLPQTICIGQHSPDEDDFSKELFANNENPFVWLNLRHKGNLYIQDLDGDTSVIDKFIAAYIFSCFNRFPLGALNIHIIDKAPNLMTIIENKLCGNSNRKILNLYSDFSVLDNLKNVVCRDVSKKIGSESRNIFDLYEKDNSETVNLVIIKTSLGSNAEYEIGNALEKIKTLSGEYGHNCGIRFLIVDTTKTQNADLNESLYQIRKNCGIVMRKESGKYSIAGLPLKPIYFKGDEITFIESQSNKILQLLAKKKKTSIPYEDIVDVKEQVVLNDAILRIPIGKAANKVIEMPFSCNNTSTTTEGMCVSYMVIGATGSGKSSLFDSIVMCGSLRYSPKDLQFWLLDFKDGVSTEKYKTAQLPHISVVADKNSPGDALALFNMIDAEMKKRQKRFSVCSGCANLYDFNQYAERNGQPRMPRIIILIDEIQELMNCEYYSEICQQLTSLASRIRAFGMHLVMIAQNLSDGRNNRLQDILSHANGRICFRIDNEETLRNSSMGSEFTERYHEIKNLGQGEIYFKYGNMNEPQRLQLAYVPSTLFAKKYFSLIQKKYNLPSQTRVVGAQEKVMIDTYSHYLRSKYSDFFAPLKRSKRLQVILGENSYTHETLNFEFSEKENSSICFIGSNKEMSNSLMVSMLASLMGKKCNIHVFNGDSSNTVIKNFINESDADNVFYRVRGDFLDTVTSIYSQFLERRRMEDDETEQTYEPIILCINDATGIRAIRENSPAEGCSNENDYSIKTVSNVLNELATQGYRYKIFTVFAITENAFEESIVANMSRIVLFHNSSYMPTCINSMLCSDMMQALKGGGEKALALYISNSDITKFRPIQYDWQEHKQLLTDIAKGENHEKAVSTHRKNTPKS